MLIDLTTLLKKYDMTLKGVIHGGAHQCEEMDVYRKNGLTENEVLWFEANPALVKDMNRKNDNLRIFNYALHSTSDRTLQFQVTNNYQSSSLLALKTHAKHYPGIKVKETIQVKTITLEDFFKRDLANDSVVSNETEEGKDHTAYNLLNLDIQGSELEAVKGFGDLIEDMEMLYLEVNKEELYQGCALVYDLDDYLMLKGFTRLDTKWVPQGWGDAFYLRRDIYREKIKENPNLMN